MKREDLSGKVFGRWRVLAYAQRPGARAHWLCRCECGTERIVQAWSLKCGNSPSCGCLSKEFCRRNFRFHGRAHTTIFNIWMSMKQRCYDPKHSAYPRYGGRGIKVCAKWKYSFERFFADMGDKPFANAQLDRIDNDGPYRKDNCRWATPSQNARNRRSNRLFNVDGKMITAAECAERAGIKHHTFLARIALGWSANRAISTALRSASHV